MADRKNKMWQIYNQPNSEWLHWYTVILQVNTLFYFNILYLIGVDWKYRADIAVQHNICIGRISVCGRYCRYFHITHLYAYCDAYRRAELKHKVHFTQSTFEIFEPLIDCRQHPPLVVGQLLAGSSGKGYAGSVQSVGAPLIGQRKQEVRDARHCWKLAANRWQAPLIGHQQPGGRGAPLNV